jgi:hypothetical protein
MPGGEVLWPRDLIAHVLRDLAAAGLVILGFDIAVKVNRGFSVYGQSSYVIDDDLRANEWDACVSRALELALRDVAHTERLTGLTRPLDDVWYAVEAIDTVEWERLKGATLSFEVRSPIGKSPTIKLFLDAWRAGRKEEHNEP